MSQEISSREIAFKAGEIGLTYSLFVIRLSTYYKLDHTL
jgi:hypothetical protein